MDELLQDFLVETGEHVEAVASQLVAFEKTPSDREAIANIYRLVHTIKGTCGFLDLPRLEKVAHAAEALIARVRDAGQAPPEAVTAILCAVDRIKLILEEIGKNGGEPAGDDLDLIATLEAMAGGDDAARFAAFAHDLLAGDLPAEEEAPAGVGCADESQASASVPHMQAAGAGPSAALSGSLAAPEPRTPLAARGAETATQANARGDHGAIRVTVDALDRIMRLVSELVLARNQLLEVARGLDEAAIGAPLQRLSSLMTDLQDSVMRTRMQPIERVFSKLPRQVRDLSRELGKPIELELEGAETELDRQLVEVVRDPLTHIIRNCADHGIESPQERLARGKPETGRIHVRAAQEAGVVVVDVSDDGRGLDLARIRAKAEARGFATADQLDGMSPSEISRFIFEPGFSTAERVTNVSGRGIGMDVVRTAIEKAGGSVAVASAEGQGARFTIKLPLTLAIAPALVIECAGERFALPQQSVTEVVSVLDRGRNRLTMTRGALTIDLRGAVIPVADLRAILRLHSDRDSRADGLVVVLRAGRATFGLLVDRVIDVQEIVVKPLDAAMERIEVYAGNTILGDGTVVLILDPPGIAARVGIDQSEAFRIDEAPVAAPGHEPMTLLLFRTQGRSTKALPLSSISRIVTARGQDIGAVDGARAVALDGALVPVITLCDIDDADPRREWPILLAGVGGEPMGIVVSEIVDVVTDHLEIEIAGASPTIVGSTIIHGQATEILDLPYFLQKARPAAFARGHARKFEILLIDDKQFFRDLLTPVISAAGYDVAAAAGGEEALTLIQSGRRFDAIVSDVDMPGMDGYAFARNVRLRLGQDAPPIIALDAHAGDVVRVAARAAGMIDVIGKFDRRALLDVLRDALDTSGFNDSAIEARLRAEAA